MIQRIQTLYMSVAGFGCLALLFIPVTKYISDAKGTYEFYMTGMKLIGDIPTVVNFWLTFPLLLLVLASLILLVGAIFLYKKRQLQIWFVNIAFLLHIVLILLLFVYYINHFESLFDTKPQYQIGIFIPILSLVCIILASRAIRKDEALVKSSDRLR
jgi:hypothetical protein